MNEFCKVAGKPAPKTSNIWYANCFFGSKSILLECNYLIK